MATSVFLQHCPAAHAWAPAFSEQHFALAASQLATAFFSAQHLAFATATAFVSVSHGQLGDDSGAFAAAMSLAAHLHTLLAQA
jgi:hypothetical protein